MRSFVHILLGYVLALLLAGTSPVGTGRGAHEGQLLDALIPHVHFVDGQRVRPGAQSPASSVHRFGPVLGAGAGAASMVVGLAITPPLPSQATALPNPSERWQPVAADDRLPLGRIETPPDPPPISRS